MRKNIIPAFFFSLFFSSSSVLAAVPGITEFPYEKTIIVPNVSSPTRVKVRLDETVMQAINQRFANFALLDARNEEVPFQVLYQEAGPIDENELRITGVSSHKSGDSKDLIDNDVLTVYSFDEKRDRQDPSWFLVDLGEPQRLVRARIYDTSRRARYIEIKGGLEQDTLRTIVSKRPFDWQFDFHSPLIRYLHVSVWGVGVEIDDLKLFRSERAEIYFEAKPGEKYRAFYGGPVNSIRYKKRLNEKSPVSVEGQLTRERMNPLFSEDFDGDGLNNDNDNCPFVSNPLQRDTDGDRIGNDCDNAPDVKNSNQYDSDYDSVGDVIDNCNLTPNKDQADRDNDGYGDACDTAHGEESTPLSSKEIMLIGFGIGILVVLIAFVGWKYEKAIRLLVQKIKK
ncbi:thrombospondin type 3 repeat-containing protein [Candidatus Gracilibacteria bacterium]|nr:thrombospondin type 3 repeat-containing protein [Candidatus Gracilibacteria bacterium]